MRAREERIDRIVGVYHEYQVATVALELLEALCSRVRCADHGPHSGPYEDCEFLSKLPERW